MGSCVGVASTFGVPLGGVLFGIEVTTSLYFSRTFLLSTIAPVIATLIYLPLFNTYRGYAEAPGVDQSSPFMFSSVMHIPATSPNFHPGEYVAFFILAVLCALIAVLQTFMMALIIRLREYTRSKIQNPHGKKFVR
jgi:H+/Cl- antiporter ClcA